nr:radical SAM family heme chaperone HemW [Desulfurobacterium pacificum]
MKALYVHVPFCKSKCPYCDFFSVSHLEYVKEYEKFLHKEFSLKQPVLEAFPTIYFGGGTPSLMPPEFFYSFLSRVSQYSEVTVEVNPESATLSYLRELKDAGINRISIGIQTLSEKLLKFLGRRHSSKQALRALENAVSVFKNVSVDIMFGIPGQTVWSIEKELKQILEFPIKHVSAYALTIYENTPFFHQLSENDLVGDEETKKMYDLIRDLLKAEGFLHYEISNFAKAGFECRHNIHYWRLDNYEGLGPSAASFVGNVYRKNYANLNRYFLSLESNLTPIEEAVAFSVKELKEMKLAMGLRLMSGVNLKSLGIKEKLEKEELQVLEEAGYIEYDFPILKLTEKACFVSNYVISKIIKALL